MDYQSDLRQRLTQQVLQQQGEINQLKAEVKALKASKSDAYTERNVVVQLAALLARRLGYKVGIKQDPALEDAAAWPVLYIDLPDLDHGQVSWHLPAREVLFRFPEYDGEWDGHTQLAKNSRLMLFFFANEEAAEEVGDGDKHPIQVDRRQTL